ncbi:MAG: O-antigen ligase family protein [Stigonema ocellatum SAG 48.90 = DSM 106950]|nr:O-antigen ligase family protein [Stigonema ocellatum SAG 48.90 = DSM 106950]
MIALKKNHIFIVNIFISVDNNSYSPKNDIANRCQLLVSLFLILLLYAILYDRYDRGEGSFLLPPNQFVSILFGINIIILIFTKTKLVILISNPIAILAAIPPLVLGLVCWLYHDYPLFEPSLLSFISRFYLIGIFSFISSRTNPLLSPLQLKRLNVILLATTLCLAISSLRIDRGQRLTFIDISTTSAHVLAVLGIISFICLSHYKPFIGRVILSTIYGVLVFICVLTQSRGGLIGLICVVILYITHISQSSLKLFETSLKKITIPLLLTIPLIYTFLSNPVSVEIISNLTTNLMTVLGRDNTGSTEELRFGIWEEYTKVILESPELLLIGTGFPRERLEGSVTSSSLDRVGAAHNYIYGSISIGGVLYLFPLILSLILLFRSMMLATFQHDEYRNEYSNEGNLIKFIVRSSIMTFLVMAFTDNFPFLLSGWPVQVVFGFFFFCAGFDGYLKRISQ